MTPREDKRLASAEQIIIDEFIKDLESTAQQVQQLLTEIRDSKIDLVTIKTEFKYVVENVKQLSNIIRDGNGNESILTRLVIIERELSDIKDYIEKDTDNYFVISTKIALLEQKVTEISLYVDGIKSKEEDKIKEKKKVIEEDKAGKWQLYVAIAGGVFTLLGSIVALLMSMWGK